MSARQYKHRSRRDHADRLPDINAVCVKCKDIPNSPLEGEIDEFAKPIRIMTKPLEYLSEHPESPHAAIDMAAAICGGHQNLADRPHFLYIITSLPHT